MQELPINLKDVPQLISQKDRLSKIIHLDAYLSSASLSHLRIAQNVIAVKVEDIAYTSPSVAENQKESENV